MLTATTIKSKEVYRAFCRYVEPGVFDDYVGEKTIAQTIYQSCTIARTEATDPLKRSSCGFWGRFDSGIIDVIDRFGGECPPYRFDPPRPRWPWALAGLGVVVGAMGIWTATR